MFWAIYSTVYTEHDKVWLTKKVTRVLLESITVYIIMKCLMGII